ncbi:MAG: hypothetical protein CVU11_02735 [Bacteroidetes bacterium HGW-Bacteroidetes-6]|nr:MAG: hypothetical protein CVU12_04470 [Bacteroidetes bacterium HGW-Bacteroidetes-7]PKP04842.1 MAG: hypothetical protein CVU11_02735 [Bacteroidetes bacterium HGW-Bacteroidetes-6]
MPIEFYLQLDSMDCGPTCLRMIAKHYGKTFSLDTLRQMSKPLNVSEPLNGGQRLFRQI